MAENKKEVWLRGPLGDVAQALQPVAHALLQAQEEINELMFGFSEEHLWKRPAGLASVGFHLQHITGVLDRLFTYAAAQQLSPAQFTYLQQEGVANSKITAAMLVKDLNSQIETSLTRLSAQDSSTLFDKREVGRDRLPSTTLGLLVHAAEHTMRHIGQLRVTIRVAPLLP